MSQASSEGTITDEAARQFRSRFPIFNAKNYLNSCSLGPLCRASREALQDYMDDWEELGAPAWWLRWIPKIDEIRGLYAAVLGVEGDALTIHHSVSSALSSIASALDYSRRPKVVVAEIDFPTIAYQWLVKSGVEVVFARSHDGITVPLEEYERLIDERTALVATSHVFYATGAVQDVAAITALAHRKGALALVDGYHAVGVMPVDARALGVDFYVCGTLKWTCGGPGLTFIYASPGSADELVPSVTGWFASADQFAFETMRFVPAHSAARFQLGTPAIATVYSGIPGIRMIQEAGPAEIYRRIQALTDRIVAPAQELGFEIASPLSGNERGGIVMLRLPEPEKAVEALASHNIVVDARPGKVRLSPHFYNTEDDVDAAMGVLARFGSAVGAAPS